MLILITILAAWLAADWLTGAFHWFEDRYLTDGQSLEFLHGIARDNQLHHEKPTAMTLNTPWQNMMSAAVVAWPLAVVLWLIGAPLFVVLTVTFSAFGNLVHRYAHVPERKLPAWIRWAQWTGLMISADHHDTHHRDESGLVSKACASRAYCPMTDWVNPVLDRLRFWDACERVLAMAGLLTVDKRGA